VNAELVHCADCRYWDDTSSLPTWVGAHGKAHRCLLLGEGFPITETLAWPVSFDGERADDVYTLPEFGCVQAAPRS